MESNGFVCHIHSSLEWTIITYDVIQWSNLCFTSLLASLVAIEKSYQINLAIIFGSMDLEGICIKPQPPMPNAQYQISNGSFSNHYLQSTHCQFIISFITVAYALITIIMMIIIHNTTETHKKKIWEKSWILLRQYHRRCELCELWEPMNDINFPSLKIPLSKT